MENAYTMTRKKRPKKAAKRDELIAMRSSVEFKQWLEETAENMHHTPTQLLEMGLIEIAKKFGLQPPPKR